MTLPREVIDALQAVHSDLGWAIVSLVELSRGVQARPVAASEDAELVEIGAGHSLIVVNPARFRALPGVQMVPLSKAQAFLALEPGRGMADLELAVLDRLERLPAMSDERRAAEQLRDRLRAWRRHHRLRFHNRSIILVERLSGAQ